MNKLKNSYTVEEMTELYAKNNAYMPNRVRVGKYAKKLGYCLAMQEHMGKRTYFYVKLNLK